MKLKCSFCDLTVNVTKSTTELDLTNLKACHTVDKMHVWKPVEEIKVHITSEAESVVLDRQATYGKPENNFIVTGIKWQATLQAAGWDGKSPIPPHVVALMLIDLKTCREAHKPKKDNRVDICGYALCEDMIIENQI